jgi:hypothetical protein
MSADSSSSGRSWSDETRPADALGHRVRPGGVAVGHEDRPHAAGRERLGGRLARLARADDDDVAPGEVADDLGGEVDRHGRDARAARAQRGLRAHALARLQRGGEQAVGERAGRARLERGLVGALTWPWTSASPTTIDSRPHTTR